LRKYFLHISYQPLNLANHFLVWCEIYNPEKNVNKIATRDDLLGVLNQGKHNFSKTAAHPFFIPHVQNYPVFPNYSFLHPEVDLKLERPEFYKKFVDCLPVNFADFEMFLDSVYSISDEDTETTASFAYFENLFQTARKIIRGGYVFPVIESDGQRVEANINPVITFLIREQLKVFIEQVPLISRYSEKGLQDAESFVFGFLKDITSVLGNKIIAGKDFNKTDKNFRLHEFFQQNNWQKHQSEYDFQVWKKWAAANFTEPKLMLTFKQLPNVVEDESKSEESLLWRMDFALKTNDKIVKGEKLFTRYALKTESYFSLQRIYARELFKAARESVFISDSLYNKNCTGVDLTVKELLHFLKEEAAQLISYGIMIRYPRFWKKIKKISVKVAFKKRGSGSLLSNGMLNSNAILDFDWQVVAGERSISVAELEQLLAKQEKFIKIDDEFFELDSTWLNNLINKIRKEEKKYAGGIALYEALNFETEGVVDKGNLLEEIIYKAQNSGDYVAQSQPEGLLGNLRHYQLSGFNYLKYMEKLNLGCILADDMGLGKTIQTIALLLNKRTEFADLIIVPTTLLYNWESEINRFAPTLKTYIHYGSSRNRDFLKNRDFDVIICSYGVVKRDLTVFSENYFDRIILDEAQYIKNPFSDQAQAVKNLRGNFRLALSGTPIENRLLELWSIMDFCNPGLLLDSASFRDRYELPIMKFQDSKKKEQLKEIITPFLLRRMKTDADIASELPDKQETKVWLPLTDEQILLYDREIKRIETKMSDNSNDLKGMMLAALTRLKQICNHPELFEKNGDYYHLGNRSAKLDNLLQMVKTISSEGRKVLIFTQFVETAQLITRYLKQELMQDILLFYGGITIGQRKKIIEEFEQSNNCPALVLSLRAGSLGLNLTVANYVVHYDRWWNPAVENQAVDRVHRLGQTRHTFIYKYICKGTLEEKIDKLIESKLALSDGIIPRGESVLTGLTPDTFLKIIRRTQ